MILHEDIFDKMFSDDREPTPPSTIEFYAEAVKYGLKNGYDVICEGLLSTNLYMQRFKSIFQTHPAEDYLFYLDVSFDETVRRHKIRPKSGEFGEESMKRWWGLSMPMRLPNEVIIPEASSLEETVKLIQKTAGV